MGTFVVMLCSHYISKVKRKQQIRYLCHWNNISGIAVVHLQFIIKMILNYADVPQELLKDPVWLQGQWMERQML